MIITEEDYFIVPGSFYGRIDSNKIILNADYGQEIFELCRLYDIGYDCFKLEVLDVNNNEDMIVISLDQTEKHNTIYDYRGNNRAPDITFNNKEDYSKFYKFIKEIIYEKHYRF